MLIYQWFISVFPGKQDEEREAEKSTRKGWVLNDAKTSSIPSQWFIVCFPGSGGAAAAPAEKPAPEFIDSRIKLYDELKAQYLDELSKKPKNPIKVTLPDGKEIEATSWESTPYDVAKGISQGLADNTVIARVNNELWDLDRPLEVDCKLQLLKFDDPDAQAVFWHSSAHILGEAMEKVGGNYLETFTLEFSGC